MKYAILAANILVGLVFTVFGLNFFFGFMPMPPMEGDMGTFAGVLASTGFLKAVKVLEVAFGVMILANFQRPLAYILLAPIVVGILFTEIFVMKQPGIAVVLTALLGFLIYSNRERYMSMLN
jgi:putative oxidoreductase